MRAALLLPVSIASPNEERMARMTSHSDPVLAAMAARRSVSKVGPETPTDAELTELLAAVTPVADHKALRPWRLITLRGDDRMRLAAALDEAAGETRAPGEVNTKPFRAELLIAVVASPREHPAVPVWKQHATARSEEHTSELQSREKLVCSLL